MKRSHIVVFGFAIMISVFLMACQATPAKPDGSQENIASEITLLPTIHGTSEIEQRLAASESLPDVEQGISLEGNPTTGLETDLENEISYSSLYREIDYYDLYKEALLEVHINETRELAAGYPTNQFAGLFLCDIDNDSIMELIAAYAVPAGGNPICFTVLDFDGRDVVYAYDKYAYHGVGEWESAIGFQWNPITPLYQSPTSGYSYFIDSVGVEGDEVWSIIEISCGRGIASLQAIETATVAGTGSVPNENGIYGYFDEKTAWLERFTQIIIDSIGDGYIEVPFPELVYATEPEEALNAAAAQHLSPIDPGTPNYYQMIDGPRDTPDPLVEKLMDGYWISNGYRVAYCDYIKFFQEGYCELSYGMGSLVTGTYTVTDNVLYLSMTDGNTDVLDYDYINETWVSREKEVMSEQDYTDHDGNYIPPEYQSYILRNEIDPWKVFVISVPDHSPTGWVWWGGKKVLS